jgi:Cytochrome oxidase complex assembly protein 1
MGTLTASLTVLAGVCFVLLGRWLYRNPRKLFLGWSFLNPEHPDVQKLARAYATFVIFFGLFTSAAVVLAFMLRRVPGMPLLILAVSVAGAWLLRPKVPPSEAPVVAAIEHPDKPRLLSKHWKRNLAIFAGLMALLMVVVSVIFDDSEVCKMSFAAAEANPVVRQRLGEPVKRGFFTSGRIEISGPSGHADIAIPVSGPHGKATVYAVARKSAGLWTFETLEIEFDQTSPRVNLLSAGSTSSPP